MDKKLTILIVEDEVIIAMDLQRILIELGYDVPVTASSGHEAIQAAQTLNPAMVLMDIVLQGDVDGIQAATEIRKRFDIPIIFLTSYADEATLARAKPVEPMGYIVKPFETRDLRTTLEMGIYKSNIDRKLRENEAWLSTILHSIGDGVVATDKKGNVKLINEVAEKLIGISLSSAVGKPISEVLTLKTSEEKGTTVDPISDVIQSGIKTELTSHYLVSKSGIEIPIDDTCGPIKSTQGGLEGTVFIFRDITERRLTQMLVLERQKMEALGVMASGVAHEVNNPLSIIYMKSRELLGELKKVPPNVEMLEQGILKIETMTMRISKTVKNMLDFVRGKLGDPIEMTPVNKIIQDAVELCSEKLSRSSVRLELSPTLAEGLFIECRPNQLVQVFVNLINNAQDAVAVLNEQWIRLGVTDEGDWITISVTDSGSGIPIELRKKILDPFFTTKTGGNGTGLGLCITKTIVDTHRGKFEIDTLDPHTRFVVMLPKAQT